MVGFHGHVPDSALGVLVVIMMVLRTVWNIQRVLVNLLNVLQNLLQIVIHFGVVALHGMSVVILDLRIRHQIGTILRRTQQIPPGYQSAHVRIVRKHVPANQLAEQVHQIREGDLLLP